MTRLLGLGPAGLFAALVLLEAGIPFPVPADLLMLLVGERAAAGAIPTWVAVIGLELVAAVGTAALFVAVRGPARPALDRVGPRIGITAARQERARRLLERRGRAALVVGRATPGLRTLTVIAAAGTSLPARACLPLLFAGSSIFLQAHFVLGYLLGPVAEIAIRRAGPIVLIVAVVALAGIGAAVSLRRRGRRPEGAQAWTEAWTEACCPACLALAALSTGRAAAVRS